MKIIYDSDGMTSTNSRNLFIIYIEITRRISKIKHLGWSCMIKWSLKRTLFFHPDNANHCTNPRRKRVEIIVWRLVAGNLNFSSDASRVFRFTFSLCICAYSMVA